jgi:putative tryptophan/tyrosine transport system substrate-binding protein
MELHSLEVRNRRDFDIALQTAERERVEALIVIVNRIVFVNRKLVGDFAQKNNLILVGVPTWLMEVGALLSYGPNVPELFGRASFYADKILKGARPSDLPMQQPTNFELIINASKAKSLGISVPQGVLARADRIID